METDPNDYYKSIENQLSQKIEPSAVNFLDYLIEHAFSMKASDIHIDPLKEGMKVRFRADGVLQEI